MLLHDLTVSKEAFEAGTGWSLREEGACRGPICIPLHGSYGDTVDVASLADEMGLPLVRDDEYGISSLGPWPGTGHALVSAVAPELDLPDLAGNEFRLSSLRGQKVLVLSWAPY